MSRWHEYLPVYLAIAVLLLLVYDSRSQNDELRKELLDRLACPGGAAGAVPSQVVVKLQSEGACVAPQDSTASHCACCAAMSDGGKHGPSDEGRIGQGDAGPPRKGH